MAGEFVSVPFTTLGTDLADVAIANLQVAWNGWEPNDSDLEVIQVEVISEMAANAAFQASQVPPRALRGFAEKFLTVSLDDGQRALATVTFTFGDTLAHTIPAGTQVNIDGWAFNVLSQVDHASGTDTEANVTVEAGAVGATANDLNVANVGMISSLDFITGVVVVDAPSGGTDPQTDDEFLDEMVRQFQLIGQTLVTTRDFELRALQEAYVGRVVAFNPGTGRNVTVVAVHEDGTALTTAEKNALTLILSDPEFRHVNVVVTVADPTYTAVSITTTVKAYPGWTLATVEDNVEAALVSIFSPSEWGRPRDTDGLRQDRWYNETIVRRNKIIDYIADVSGVDYVVSLSINGNTTTDVTLTGTVALPTPGTMAATAT